LQSASDLEKALAIALKAHKGQVDKSGQPYILHPIRMMIQLQETKAKVVALLHDVIEDSDITPNKLRREGFDSEIIEAVVCLTKKTKEDYIEYIWRVKKNHLARIVKLADLKDNLDASRLKHILPEDCQRMERYLKAIELLSEK